MQELEIRDGHPFLTAPLDFSPSMSGRAGLHSWAEKPSPPFQAKQSCGRGKTWVRPQPWIVHSKSEICTVNVQFTQSWVGKTHLIFFPITSDCHPLCPWIGKKCNHVSSSPPLRVYIKGLFRARKQVFVTDASNNHCPKFIKKLAHLGQVASLQAPSSPEHSQTLGDSEGTATATQWAQEV